MHIQESVSWESYSPLESEKTYRRIPRSSAKTYAIITNPQAANTIFMTAKSSHTFATEDVPDLLKSMLAFGHIGISGCTSLTLHSKSS